MKPCDDAADRRHCEHLIDHYHLPDRYTCALTKANEAEEPCMESDMRHCHNWMRANGIPIVVAL